MNSGHPSTTLTGLVETQPCEVKKNLGAGAI
jgi:hypothetical protein